MERYYTKNELMNLFHNPYLIKNIEKNLKKENTNENPNSSNNSTKCNSSNSISDMGKNMNKLNESNSSNLQNKENFNFKLIDLKKFFCNEKFQNLNKDFNLNNYIDEEETFSLIQANFIKNSLLQFTKDEKEKYISGITIPWYYLGMLFSTFCWHTEDLYLYSLNYLHDGSPKIWYGIPLKDKEKMDDYIKNKYYGILLKQPDLIHRLTVHIDPKELKASGINVFRVVQNPGDLILTLPKAYHTGFSTGINMAEAINFSVNYFYYILFLILYF